MINATMIAAIVSHPIAQGLHIAGLTDPELRRRCGRCRLEPLFDQWLDQQNRNRSRQS
jgi:hypothetical protein